MFILLFYYVITLTDRSQPWPKRINISWTDQPQLDTLLHWCNLAELLLSLTSGCRFRYILQHETFCGSLRLDGVYGINNTIESTLSSSKTRSRPYSLPQPRPTPSTSTAFLSMSLSCLQQILRSLCPPPLRPRIPTHPQTTTDHQPRATRKKKTSSTMTTATQSMADCCVGLTLRRIRMGIYLCTWRFTGQSLNILSSITEMLIGWFDRIRRLVTTSIGIVIHKNPRA